MSSQTISKEAVPNKSIISKIDSNADINSKKITNMSMLYNYIGSKYPHFKLTVLPVAIVFGIIAFKVGIVVMIIAIDQAVKTEQSEQSFYRKCKPHNDDLLGVAKWARTLKVGFEAYDLTPICILLISPFLITFSHRRLVIICLICTIFCCFVVSHTTSFRNVLFFAHHSLAELFKIVSIIMVLESLPKYHRIAAIALIEMVEALGYMSALQFVRYLAKFEIKITYLFEFCGFLSIIAFYITFLTFRDSLYSLLILGKFDKLEARLSEMFKASNINLPADAVVDSVAFENFETNDNIAEILWKTLKSGKLLREIFVIGIICGCSTTMSFYIQNQLNKNLKVFDAQLIKPTALFVSALLALFFAIIMPKHRLMPVILTFPLLLISICILKYISFFGSVKNLCTLSFTLTTFSSILHLVATIIALSSLYLSEIFLKVHLIEFLPTMIRLPAVAGLMFVKFSFGGTMNAIDAGMDSNIVIFLATLRAMMLLLITPRKSIEMSVYFSELVYDQKRVITKKAPEVVSENKIKK